MKKNKAKKVQGFLVFWYGFVFCMSAGASAFMLLFPLTLDPETINNILPMTVFGWIFFAIALLMAGFLIAMMVSYSRLKKIEKYGKVGKGMFLSSFTNMQLGGGSHGTRQLRGKWMYNITFEFYDDKRNLYKVRTNSVYYEKEAKSLEKAGKFEIKYIGSKAIIVEDLFALEKKQKKAEKSLEKSA